MPRAPTKAGREAEEIGAAIVAAWFKALPANAGTVSSVKSANPELGQVLGAIVDAPVTLEFDEDLTGNGVYVVVPRIPNKVKTKTDLLTYLQSYHEDGEGRHYHEELGKAVLFGCR